MAVLFIEKCILYVIRSPLTTSFGKGWERVTDMIPSIIPKSTAWAGYGKMHQNPMNYIRTKFSFATWQCCS